MYQFTFNGGVEIKEISTGNTIFSLPKKPINAGSVAWVSEEEALAWMEEAYPQYFMEYGDPIPPEEVVIPSEEPAAEEPAPDTPPA